MILIMRLESKAEKSLLRFVIAPSELASEPTSLVRGRMIDELFLTDVLFYRHEPFLRGRLFCYLQFLFFISTVFAM